MLLRKFARSAPHLDSLLLATAAWIGFAIPHVVAVEAENAPSASVEIAAASDEASEAIGTFKIIDDLQIELVAAEPIVANIVAMDIDPAGNIYVAETFRQSNGVTDNRSHDQKWLEADLAAHTVQDRIDYHRRLLGDAVATYTQGEDRIRKLSDTDGDGVMDKSIIVADGFSGLEEGTGAGVLAIGNSVYYTCIPKLWQLTDTTGDGVADQKQVLSDGYGVRVAFRGHDSHGLIVGPDGRLYFSIGDRGYHITTADGTVIDDPTSGAVFRCNLDGTDLTVVARGMRNPQELAFNDVGDLFSVDNNSDSGDKARIVQVLPDGDTGWRMHYQYLPDRGIFNREKIWHPLHDEQTVSIVPPIANFTDGPSGLAYYPGTGFDAEFKNRFLICDFRGGSANSGVRSFELKPAGAFYEFTSDEQPIWQILPTDVMFGSDGGLYVSDWVDGWNGLGKGRIYKFTSKSADKAIVDRVHAILTSPPGEAGVEALIDQLGHADMRVRQRSQFELVRRGDLNTLRRVATDTKSPMLARLHAVWGIGQIGREGDGLRRDAAALLRGQLGDPNAEVVRAALLQLVELASADDATAITASKHQENARVQYAVWMALAAIDSDAQLDMVASRLQSESNHDPALRHAGIMYWAKAASDDRLRQIADSSAADPMTRRYVVAALRRLKSPLISTFLSDPDPAVVGEAVRALHDDNTGTAAASILDMAKSNSITSQQFETIARMINVADRVRSEEAADALIALASNESLAEDVRISAIETLGHWTQPLTIDRYDHTYRPRPAAPPAIIAAPLRKALPRLTEHPGAIKRATIQTAAAAGIREIAPELKVIAGREKETVEDRAGAIAALSKLDPAAAMDLAKLYAADPSREIALASLTVLASTVDANIDKMIAATGSSDIRVRQMGWDMIGRSQSPTAVAFLTKAAAALTDSKIEPDVQLNVIESIASAKARLPADVTAKVDAMLAEREAKTDLSKYAASLVGGDPNLGKVLFFENTKLSCVRCHLVDRAGGAVGPPLTVIGAEKTPEYLLESICFPDAAIAKGFETTVVATDEGQVVSGIVASDDDDYLTLMLNDGTKQRVLQEAIVARRPGKSSMPSDLINYMSRRELRDLVAYLSSLKVDPRAAGEAE